MIENLWFTYPSTWDGGYIELVVVLGSYSIKQLHNAYHAVWKWPYLQGPYADRTVEPSEQSLAPPTLEGPFCGYGIAEVPNGMQVAFLTNVMAFEDSSWLEAAIPLGSLGMAYPIGGFPFGRSATEPWAQEVYEWLFQLAQHLFEHVQFERGIIGWEVPIDVNEWLNQAQPPEVRYEGYIVVTSDGLEYLAPNVTGALMTFGSDAMLNNVEQPPSGVFLAQFLAESLARLYLWLLSRLH